MIDSMKRISLVVLDIDGTVVTTKSGSPFRETPDDWKFLPGRQELVRKLLADGVNVAIATNQGSVAYGINTQAEIQAELERTVSELAGPASGEVFLRAAYNHPKGSVPEYTKDDDFRKPGGGMIRAAMEHFGVAPRETLMVGDRPEDKAAAEAAGCNFCWADEFFELSVPAPALELS